MTLVAAAMDGERLNRSAHILITAMGECRNSDERWAGNVLIERGGAPILYTDLQGEYLLPSIQEMLRVYGLTAEGERAEEIPVLKQADGFLLALKGYVHYEVTAP